MARTTARRALALLTLVFLLVPSLASAQLNPNTVRGLTQVKTAVASYVHAGKSGAALGQAIWKNTDLWASSEVQSLVTQLRNGTVTVDMLVDPGTPMEPILNALATMPVADLPFAPNPAGTSCQGCRSVGSYAVQRCTGEMPLALRTLFEDTAILQFDRPPTLPAADIAEITRGLTNDVTRIMEEAGPVHEAIVNDALATVRACGGNEKCIREGIEAAVAKQSGPLSRFCLGRNPVAMRSLINNYVINFTALGVAYWGSDSDEFPFDYLATIAILGALWGEVGCKAQLEGAGAAPGTGAGSGAAPSMFQKYRQYIKAAPVAAGTVVGTSLTEDYIRGDIKHWSHYAKEGAMVIVHDLAWANPKMAWVYDPLYLGKIPMGGGRLGGMPQMRLWMNGQYNRWLVQPLASRGMARASTFIGKGAGVPGSVSELAVRWGFRTFDTWVFINVREFVTTNNLIGAPPTEQTAPAGGEIQDRVRVDYMTPKPETFPQTLFVRPPDGATSEPNPDDP